MLRRSLFAVLLLAFLGGPLLLALVEAATPSAWTAWLEADRIAELAANTFGLISLTLLFALPPGIALAVLLERTDLPGARFFRAALGVSLFVPLPLFALAWQSVGGGGWRPWTQGLWFASFIHAAAALPWVVWLVGLGLSRVEPELEEDALTAMPAWRVLWHVSLRRASPAIGLSIVWVALQAAGEIAVTDMAIVRTFAEEVYTQFVLGGPDSLGRAVAIALPSTILSIVVVAVLMRRWNSRLTLAVPSRPAIVRSLGVARWPIFGVVLFGMLAFAGVPLVSLIRQAGGGDDWSVARVSLELRRAMSLHLVMVVESLLWALTAGVVAATLALAASWLASDSRWLRGSLFALAMALWAVPGPVLGFGLKETIELLMQIEDFLLGSTSVRPIQAILYQLSTPMPVLWAHTARFLPYAVAILWPAVRDVPRELRESARVDGATPWVEFRRVGWPACRRSFFAAVIAVAALSMGELAASKIVQVPGRSTFAQELFAQMHYGSTATTAALALVQLLPAVVAWWIVARTLRVR